MDIKSLFYEAHGNNKTFKKTGYTWLDSDWSADEWVILDPVESGLSSKSKIKFDCVLTENKTFLDFPELLEDIKRSIVYAVEVKGVLPNGSKGPNSRSAILAHARSLFRVWREVFELGHSSLSDLTQRDVELIKQQLLYPEYYSLSYAEKLERTLESMSLKDIPLLAPCGSKRPSSVDTNKINLKAGIADHRECQSCLCIYNNINKDLSQLYPNERWSEKNLLPSSVPIVRKKYNSLKTSKNLLSGLNVLFEQSVIIKDFKHSLTINPFDEETLKEFLSKEYKRIELRDNSGRTKNIPVKQFLELMDIAVRWIVDYSDPLFDLEQKIINEKNELSTINGRESVRKRVAARVREESSKSEWINKKASPFPLSGFSQSREKVDRKYDEVIISSVKELIDSKVSRKEGASLLNLTEEEYSYISRRLVNDYYLINTENTGVSLNQALYSYLPFCCTLILLAFTAGRESSIQNLRSGCITKVGGNRYIELYIPKTLRSYEKLPTVALVERAVGILERLSAAARKESKSDVLYQFITLHSNNIRSLRFEHVYPRFFEFIGMPKDEDGKHWKLSEHQFRRFFAIMYFYRYGASFEASYSALMHHLRHTDWTMTNRYLSEASAGQVLKDVEDEFLKDIFAKELASGGLSEKLKGTLLDIESSVLNSTDIIQESHLERISQQMDAKSLVYNFLPFAALCFGLSPGRNSEAKCAIQHNGESVVCIHKASETVCSGCPNLFETKHLSRFDTNENEELTPLACSSPILDAVVRKSVEGSYE